MSKPKALLVEDARDIHILVSSAIGELCEITIVTTLACAATALNEQSFELLILDVNLPDGESFPFCAKVKQSPRFKNLPVIFLTSEAAVERKVQGFSSGADDYVVKPFEPIEFAARVSSKLRNNLSSQTTVSAAGLRVDLVSHRAFSETKDGEIRLSLTPIEIKILAFLLQHPGIIISRDSLKEQVWGIDVHISAHTIETHMSSLRKKLGPFSEKIKAIPKKGYTFSNDPAGPSTSDH